MLDILRKLLRSKYVRGLEEEVARLRAENRALMNSLLGTAGFPPVKFPEASKPQPLPRLRKRSWHQLRPGARMKQIAPARIINCLPFQPSFPVPKQSRHSRRRPEASLRLHHQLQSLPGQARRRPGRPHRRTPENHLTHTRTRRRFAHRSRRQHLAPYWPRRQMVPQRRRSRRRCLQNRSARKVPLRIQHFLRV